MSQSGISESTCSETDNYCYSVDSFVDEEEELEVKKNKKSPRNEIKKSKKNLEKTKNTKEAKSKELLKLRNENILICSGGYSINEDDYNIEDLEECEDSKSYVLSEGELCLDDRVNFSDSSESSDSFEVQPLIS